MTCDLRTQPTIKHISPLQLILLKASLTEMSLFAGNINMFPAKPITNSLLNKEIQVPVRQCIVVYFKLFIFQQNANAPHKNQTDVDISTVNYAPPDQNTTSQKYVNEI